MTDQVLHYFWIVVTALFIFSAAYSWFVAIIVRKPLPGEMVWIYTGLAFVAGSNAFVYSGEQVVDVEHVMIVSGLVFFIVGLSSVLSVVEMGNQYNGDISSRIPLSQQWRILRRGIKQKEQEVNSESSED